MLKKLRNGPLYDWVFFTPFLPEFIHLGGGGACCASRGEPKDGPAVSGL
jgi:hypothetical protein